jgi:hypothetical protein
MNQLKVNRQHSIVSLFEQGWSKRRIARELALDRATVRKYLAGVTPKSPTPQTGSAQDAPSKSPTPPQTGSATNPGPASLCDRWHQQIQSAWQAGLSVQRIYQDLVAENQFAGSYHAVRRFVLRHHGGAELPFRRMESEPGQELQVDFGQGAWVMEKGKRRKTHLFRGVLSHSRKAYSEAVWRQTKREFHPLPGKCLPAFWRSHRDGGDRQLEGGRDSGRLVRSTD